MWQLKQKAIEQYGFWSIASIRQNYNKRRLMLVNMFDHTILTNLRSGSIFVRENVWEPLKLGLISG